MYSMGDEFWVWSIDGTMLVLFFYIHGSVNRDAVLIRSNKMQQYAGIYLLQNFTLHMFRVSIAPIIR